jgi:hypothetical protein
VRQGISTTALAEFSSGLKHYLIDPHTRPFVCTGSPLQCRSFIVGLNAATRLREPFWAYWSDETGFDRAKFDSDYSQERRRKGNRPVIEAIGKEIGPCLETNLYAMPTRKAKELTAADREKPIIEYLFRSIKPALVFVHSNEPMRFFATATGCGVITPEGRRARWHGHEFWLAGRSGPLYTLGAAKGTALGASLAKHLV